jgi:Protein of unknown function (DUF2510)
MTRPSPLPGWYPDPSGVPAQRYWDGQKWGPKAPAQQQPQVVINNTNTVATAAPVYVATGPNHALHAVLTLFTCGAWLPIWIIIAIVDAGQSRVVQQAPYNPTVVKPVQGPPSKMAQVFLAVIAVFVFIAIFSTNPAVAIALAVLTSAGCFGYAAYQRAAKRRAEQGRIAARADAEHRASLEGNPAGTYGQYPPPPLPEPDQWPPPNLP